jgi:hypothetical protein
VLPHVSRNSWKVLVSKADGMAQVIERLHSKHSEALSSNPSTTPPTTHTQKKWFLGTNDMLSGRMLVQHVWGSGVWSQHCKSKKKKYASKYQVHLHYMVYILNHSFIQYLDFRVINDASVKSCCVIISLCQCFCK